MRRAGLALALAAVAGCGGSDKPQPRIDGEAFAHCVVNLTGAPPADLAQIRGLTPDLRAAATRGRRVQGSLMPAPHGFAAFVGADRTFSPAGFDAAEFVPAAFVVFGDAGAAEEREDDADRRVGNLLIVYDGDPPEPETGLVDQCVEKVT